jgi:hypothetical protein
MPLPKGNLLMVYGGTIPVSLAERDKPVQATWSVCMMAMASAS